MKHREIVAVIENRFVRINNSFHKVAAHFDKEDIQLFRTEVKKLRSFLRLVGIGFNNPFELDVPEQLKKFYKITGIIRNLQLQQQRIRKVIEEATEMQPDWYLTILDIEIAESIAHANHLAGERKSFKKERITGILHGKLSNTMIKKFVQSETDTFQKLLVLQDRSDESLLQVCRLVTDILYTWPYIKENTATILTSGLCNYDHIKSLFGFLTEFQDACTGLRFLEADYTGKISKEEERIFLLNIQKEWQEEKESFKHKIYGNLFKFQLIPSAFGESVT